MSAEDERSRPAGNGPAKKSLTTNTPDSSAAAFQSGDLARCANLERQYGFELGVEAIYRAGVAMLPGARKIWRHPRYAELEAKRNEVITTGCGLRSCPGRCSRCVRAYAFSKNQRLYGGSDFPGVLALRRTA